MIKLGLSLGNIIRRSIQKNIFFGSLKLWVTCISIGFILYSVASNAQDLSQLSFNQGSRNWLLSSILISTIALYINALAWQSLLTWMKIEYEGTNLIQLYLDTNILKYLPGGIWHFIERIRVLKTQLHAGKALLAVLIEPILMVSASLLLVPFGGFYSGISLLCFVPSLIFLPGLRNRLILFLENYKYKQIKKIDPSLCIQGPKNIDEYDNYPIKSLSIEILFVITRFIGFWFCLNSFSIHEAMPIFQWLSIFSLAWTIGLIIPGAPGGVGVFESFIYIGLADSLPEANLLAVLLSYRLVVTIADLMAPIFFKLFILKLYR